MGVRWRLQGWVLCAVCVLGPGVARADLIFGPDGQPLSVRDRQVLVVFDGQRQVTIEEKRVVGVTGPIVHIRTFPAPPVAKVAPDEPFAELKAFLERRPPLRLAIRDRPFGPSFMARWFGPPPPPKPEADLTALPSLRPVERLSFQAEVATSTTTRPEVIPEGFDHFLERNQIRISAASRAAVSKYLKQGQTVVATVWRAGATPADHRLGPVRFDVLATQAQLTFPSLDRERMDVYLAAGGPLVPAQLAAPWSTTPWASKPLSPGQAEIRNGARWGPDQVVAAPWFRMALTPVRSVEYATHLRYRSNRENYRSLTFVPSTGGGPAPESRGTAWDLILCIFLGFVPVLAAPESWLFAILQSRSRARATPTRSGWTTRLWAVWPLAVAVFWLVSVPGAAKTAALLPAIVGLFAARPYEVQREGFVRARLTKRKAEAK